MGDDAGGAGVGLGLAVWVWATARLAEVRKRSQVKRILIFSVCIEYWNGNAERRLGGSLFLYILQCDCWIHGGDKPGCMDLP